MNRGRRAEFSIFGIVKFSVLIPCSLRPKESWLCVMLTLKHASPNKSVEEAINTIIYVDGMGVVWSCRSSRSIVLTGSVQIDWKNVWRDHRQNPNR